MNRFTRRNLSGFYNAQRTKLSHLFRKPEDPDNPRYRVAGAEKASRSAETSVRMMLKAQAKRKRKALRMGQDFGQRPDNCSICHGSKGGVRGNENIVDGVVMCDYCHAATLTSPERSI